MQVFNKKRIKCLVVSALLLTHCNGHMVGIDFGELEKLFAEQDFFSDFNAENGGMKDIFSLFENDNWFDEDEMLLSSSKEENNEKATFIPEKAPLNQEEWLTQNVPLEKGASFYKEHTQAFRFYATSVREKLLRLHEYLTSFAFGMHHYEMLQADEAVTMPESLAQHLATIMSKKLYIRIAFTPPFATFRSQLLQLDTHLSEIVNSITKESDFTDSLDKTNTVSSQLLKTITNILKSLVSESTKQAENLLASKDVKELLEKKKHKYKEKKRSGSYSSSDPFSQDAWLSFGDDSFGSEYFSSWNSGDTWSSSLFDNGWSDSSSSFWNDNSFWDNSSFWSQGSDWSQFSNWSSPSHSFSAHHSTPSSFGDEHSYSSNSSEYKTIPTSPSSRKTSLIKTHASEKKSSPSFSLSPEEETINSKYLILFNEWALEYERKRKASLLEENNYLEKILMEKNFKGTIKGIIQALDKEEQQKKVRTILEHHTAFLISLSKYIPYPFLLNAPNESKNTEKEKSVKEKRTTLEHNQKSLLFLYKKMYDELPELHHHFLTNLEMYEETRLKKIEELIEEKSEVISQDKSLSFIQKVTLLHMYVQSLHKQPISISYNTIHEQEEKEHITYYRRIKKSLSSFVSSHIKAFTYRHDIMHKVIEKLAHLKGLPPAKILESLDTLDARPVLLQVLSEQVIDTTTEEKQKIEQHLTPFTRRTIAHHSMTFTLLKEIDQWLTSPVEEKEKNQHIPQSSNSKDTLSVPTSPDTKDKENTVEPVEASAIEEIEKTPSKNQLLPVEEKTHYNTEYDEEEEEMEQDTRKQEKPSLVSRIFSKVFSFFG